MSLTEQPTRIICPVCGGSVTVTHEDKVNRCEYCGSPVLGPSQNRDCVNHPGVLATDVCHVCGDLICDECTEKRVGEYGGKLLTIVNCGKPECVKESEWAKPLNEEFQRLANMDWADRIDNLILRVTGLGAITMMVFELIFILGLFYIFNFTSWGFANVPRIASAGYTGFWLSAYGNGMVLLLNIIGNLLGAILLMAALQVYVHEKQLSSGIMLIVVLVMEVAHLLLRGWYFNLINSPFTIFVEVLLAAFLTGTVLVFIGSLMAIYIGNKKRIQLNNAKKQLGLS
ncbi:MAG: hypothetical protein DRO87_03970 [Candidatus Thorarchaeota archaeon]|nr:MAG: hypothetical protein DRP09_05530 [Candidatus Thorarchaeota archaeon]RLI59067.1 MAG: hypothetical protein DRO87_03970 [Candidatus Thorarchaeota archaeon]